MFPNTDSKARQHERHELVLPIRLSPSEHAGQQVRFRTRASTNKYDFEGDLIDLSRGGVGFMCHHYLPKGTRVDLRVCGLDGDPTRAILVARGRVQRVRMTDSRPAYLIGAAFIDSDAVFEHDLGLLLNRLSATDCTAPPDRTPHPDTDPGTSSNTTTEAA